MNLVREIVATLLERLDEHHGADRAAILEEWVRNCAVEAVHAVCQVIEANPVMDLPEGTAPTIAIARYRRALLETLNTRLDETMREQADG